MVTRYGMYEKLGNVAYEERQQPFLGEMASRGVTQRNYSEETAREIDCAVRELVERARETALQILNANRQQLEDGVKLLLEKETLLSDELPKTRMITEQQRPAIGSGIGS